jgi:hypothetical protein
MSGAEVTDVLADAYRRTGHARPREHLLGVRQDGIGGPVLAREGPLRDEVVLWWIGEKPVKKTDATFKRLHTVLTKATR